MRTIEDIGPLLSPLEDIKQQKLIPALTGRNACDEVVRRLLALPPNFGGLGILNPSSEANRQFATSRKITAPLVDLISNQDPNYSIDPSAIRSIKASAKREHHQSLTCAANAIKALLSQEQVRAMELAQERGASSWLSTLPLEEHGFALHKGGFRDAICLRYLWDLPRTPVHCACGQKFDVDHAMCCPKGGFPTLRHNKVRDLTADLLTEVCGDVEREPLLQRVTGEQLNPSSNQHMDACLDIRAQGVWERGQSAFFDERVFHPNVPSYHRSPLPTIYRRHENPKKHEYADRVLQIEQGSFTPLVFSSTGGMAAEATVFYKRLANLIASKQGVQYSTYMGWLRCRKSFALMRSSLLCIRGSRSSMHYAPLSHGLDLVVQEGRVLCNCPHPPAPLYG